MHERNKPPEILPWIVDLPSPFATLRESFCGNIKPSPKRAASEPAEEDVGAEGQHKLEQRARRLRSHRQSSEPSQERFVSLLKSLAPDKEVSRPCNDDPTIDFSEELILLF